MITLKHIKIYELYKGDGDGFIRCATSDERSIMDYKHWTLINSLVQDITIVKRGLASDAFARTLNERLKEECDSEETVEALIKTASLN